MEASGQLHAPAALPLGKDPPPPVPIGYEAGWDPELVWRLKRREIPLLLPGIEPKFPTCPSQALQLAATPLPINTV
jgi:hypothetical protein